jgi:hypothetical protein
MTTLRQKLVRKKNRKLRRLRELYPDVRIKLFYARDFRALMLKYGKLALADGLSGSAGQVMHVEPAAAGDEEPAPAVTVGAGAPDGTVDGTMRGAGRRRRRRRTGTVAAVTASLPEGPTTDR